MEPDLQTGRFKGNVKISLSITKPTDTITLHSHGLMIENIEFKTDSNSHIPVSL